MQFPNNISHIELETSALISKAPLKNVLVTVDHVTSSCIEKSDDVNQWLHESIEKFPLQNGKVWTALLNKQVCMSGSVLTADLCTHSQ